MAPTMDEKREIIIRLLDNMRPYNARIGSYEKSIYTEDFDYSVKLSNGRMRMSEELLQDYEKNPSSITNERYKIAAGRFAPNELVPQENMPTYTPTATFNVKHAPPPIKKKSNAGSWVIITIAILVALGALGYYVYTYAEQAQAKAKARIDISSLVVVEGSNYNVDRIFGGISGLKISVTNNSDYTVDMVKVKVTYFKSDGGVYKNEMVYFNRISPHSNQTLDAPRSDRGVKVEITTESISCSEINR